MNFPAPPRPRGGLPVPLCPVFSRGFSSYHCSHPGLLLAWLLTKPLDCHMSKAISGILEHLIFSYPSILSGIFDTISHGFVSWFCFLLLSSSLSIAPTSDLRSVALNPPGIRSHFGTPTLLPDKSPVGHAFAELRSTCLEFHIHPPNSKFLSKRASGSFAHRKLSACPGMRVRPGPKIPRPPLSPQKWGSAPGLGARPPAVPVARSLRCHPNIAVTVTPRAACTVFPSRRPAFSPQPRRHVFMVL